MLVQDIEGYIAFSCLYHSNRGQIIIMIGSDVATRKNGGGGGIRIILVCTVFTTINAWQCELVQPWQMRKSALTIICTMVNDLVVVENTISKWKTPDRCSTVCNLRCEDHTWSDLSRALTVYIDKNLEFYCRFSDTLYVLPQNLM